jgi:cytoskeleton protein RodZ
MNLARVGCQLATLRKDKGVSLADISSQTKICQRYLEAIEAGRLEELPGGIYRRSYIRQYAYSVDSAEASRLWAALSASELTA